MLEQVRQKALDAYGSQDVPFELLVEQLNPARSAAHHPLFQVAMAFQNNVRPEVALDGVTVEQLTANTHTAKFDLDIQLSEVPTETRPRRWPPGWCRMPRICLTGPPSSGWSPGLGR